MFDDSSSRIVRHLRSVVAGSMPGSRLPSTRSLVEEFDVGAQTVQKAIARLVAEGIVETRPGSGSFVLAPATPVRITDYSWQTTSLGVERSGPSPIGSTLRPVSGDVIAMHGGYPSADLMPMREVRSALAKAARSAEAFVRPPVDGLPELQSWFVRDLAGGDGSWRDRDAVITSGGQSALSAVFRALASPGDAIVMESPTYWGAISAARQAGLVIVPVARTTHAPDPEALDEALRTSGASMFYAQPNFANPTGALWNTAERSAILEVMARRGAFLIEDDWAHDFSVDGSVVPLAAADTDGHVIYIRSLTKSASLALRVAAVIARGPARRRIANALAVSDLYVSPILQSAALDVVTRPSWRSHCARVARELRSRRDLLVDVLTDYCPQAHITHVPAGGINVWLRLSDEVDAETFTARCLADGLSISAGGEWFPGEVSGPHVRLNYGSSDPARYGEAAQIMSRLLTGG